MQGDARLLHMEFPASSREVTFRGNLTHDGEWYTLSFSQVSHSSHEGIKVLDCSNSGGKSKMDGDRHIPDGRRGDCQGGVGGGA